jgi:hypothetical protein
MTWDGSVQRTYMNGVEVGKVNRTGSMTPSGKPLRFGGNAVWAEWFKGQIDEVRIYNRALTTSEITKDRDTPITNATVSSAAGTRAKAGTTRVAKAKPVHPSKKHVHKRHVMR